MGLLKKLKARAMFWTFSVAKEQGWRHVLFEGDCKVIIDSMNGKSSQCCVVQSLLDNTASLSFHFESISFVVCYRECNGAAHKLVRWAASGVSDEVWVDVGPTWLRDALYSDLNHS